MSVKINEKEPLVTIKPQAYLKMLKHVLRFGSMAKKKSQYKECMGMLMGKLGGLKGTVKDVVVVDAIPFTHGGHIEVQFEDKDYVAFAEINEKYAQEGVFNVGWYHSHPGLTTFLSTVDVRNHLGFQTTNPSAIAIVWDHLLLEEENHNGFETFRLTELGKGQYSDYKTVQTIVENPETIEFYKSAIKEILDLQQGGNPPILEVNELPSALGDFDVTAVDDAKFVPPQITVPSNTADAIITGGKVTANLTAPLADYLNNWAKDLSQSLKNKAVVVNQNFTKLKDVIEKGIKDIQVWFMNEAYEEMLKVWEKVDDLAESKENVIKSLEEALNQTYPLPENKKDQLNKTIPEILEQIKGLRNKSGGK